MEVLRKYIKDETVDLCYIDPPFNSNRTYNQIYLNQGEEDKAQAHAFVDTWEWDTTAEKGYIEILENEANRFTNQTIFLIQGLEKVLGKDSLLSYLIHITLRATEIHRALKPTGSFYLHCDPTACHYLKLILDAIFVANGGEYRNDVIWCYRKWSIAQSQFVSNHDNIFFYTKSKDNYFKVGFVPLSAGTLKRWKGKKQQATFSEGTRMASNLNEDSEGSPIPDWWEISIINPAAKERLGYPTQKPEMLLERIIEASSKEGDVVLDAYCGCGTTVAVAERLHRRWIGIDITYQSISLILWRLESSLGKSCLGNIELNGVPQDWESARALAEKVDDKTRKEFEKWAVLFYTNNRGRINEKKGGDKGIDGTALIQERDAKGEIINKKVLFSVKSDKNLVPAYVNQLQGKMHESDVVMGILLCLYEPTKGMLREAKEMGVYKNGLFDMEYPKFQIITVREMFEGKRLTIPAIEAVKKAEFKGKENRAQELF